VCVLVDDGVWGESGECVCVGVERKLYNKKYNINKKKTIKHREPLTAS